MTYNFKEMVLHEFARYPNNSVAPQLTVVPAPLLDETFERM
jgi:hypothetical protein